MHGMSFTPSPRVAYEMPPQKGPPDLLFLLFHGVGATSDGMRPLAERLRAQYPQALIAGIDAPYPYDGGTGGFQWFSVQGSEPGDSTQEEAVRADRVAEALPMFIALVRAMQARLDIEWERTALFGFSQGATMALEAVQAQPQLAGRVVAFSGRYASQPVFAPEDTTVHIVHGLADGAAPYRPQVEAAQRLVTLGGDVTADVLPGIGHELHELLQEKALEQLRTFLPKKVWRAAMSEAPIVSRVASSRELGPSSGDDCEGQG